jgi:cytochrome c-type biogenesis protein CcmH
MRRAATQAVVVACALLVGAPTIAYAGGQARAPRDRGDSATLRPPPADTALESLTRSVAAQLRCPVCQGLSLADSPSELALEMKDVVREQLAGGRTPDEVKSYFVAKYGEWILLEPPPRGVNLLAYLLPVTALVVGLAVIWLALGRWTRGRPPADEAPFSEVD